MTPAPLIGWTYDIAREQTPDAALLRQLIGRSAAAGYGAIGLYLEHRFAYSAAPWAAAAGALTPEIVRGVQAHARGAGVRVIPMLNTLGHMEGFIRSCGGEWLAEGPVESVLSLQICPSRRECREFARALIADCLAAFDDEWVHLGGDEARQLGECPVCAPRAAELGRAGLYAEYYADLCRGVLQRGRRPCLWADMLLAHPQALDAIPRETLLFDWQYDHSPQETSTRLRSAGFDVVCCPALHTFDSAWCYLDTTRQNVDAHAATARSCGAAGVFLTTWEMSCGVQYSSVWPLIFAVGRRLALGATWAEAIEREGGAEYARAAELLGVALPRAARFLAPGTWRLLRDRLVIRQNPLRLWRDWREEACGEAGDRVLAIGADAAALLPSDHELQAAVELHVVAVQWVRAAERAAQAYQRSQTQECVAALRAGRRWLERLGGHWQVAAARGGSAVDPQRLARLLERIDGCIERVQRVAPQAGARPSFATLAHEAWIPGDQAAWRTSQP